MATAARSPAGIGFWDYLTGWDENTLRDFLERLAVSNPPHLYSYPCFLVAEIGGQRAGALSAFRPETHGFGVYIPVFMRLVRETAGDAAVAEMMERARLMTELEISLPPDRWHIESVATAPEFRRQGVADRLLAAAIERGRAEGCAVAAIDTVFADNESALRGYERHGFSTVQRIRSEAWEATFQSPGLDVLTRDI
ncbi:MAG TPA: N-acetyltransferase [Acidimicrobiales bacterium]|nr:N-acetyltransferase [Acidimicrobiales bacterium]